MEFVKFSRYVSFIFYTYRKNVILFTTKTIEFGVIKLVVIHLKHVRTVYQI